MAAKKKRKKKKTVAKKPIKKNINDLKKKKGKKLKSKKNKDGKIKKEPKAIKGKNNLYREPKKKTKIDLNAVKDTAYKTLQVLKKAFIWLLRKILIILLTICKVFLITVKFIKNWFIKQYNRIKIRRKKEKKIFLKEENDNDDLPDLLHYRDYQGIDKVKVFFKNRVRVIKFDMKKFKKKFKYGTIKDKILILLMLGLIAGFSLIIVFCVYIVISAPEISNERLYKSNATTIYDKNNEVIARRGSENREKITYDYIPQVLIDAIVSAEDSRFFQHNGIDIARFSKAVFGQLLGHGDAGGGSTLTMQISKQAATNPNSVGFAGIKRKFQDIYLSVFVFEKKYTKEQIMEFYVNLPYLGAGTYGVEQASKAYFGKSSANLTLVEAATIAGLFQSPDADDPFKNPQAAENRRNTVLNLMEHHGYITKEECEEAKKVPMESLLISNDSTFGQNQDIVDTVFAEVRSRTGDEPTTTSMNIYTNFDMEKQAYVSKLMREGVHEDKVNWNWKTEKTRGGIAVIDVDSGALIAVGSNRESGQMRFNYATGKDMSRQPGSTAKPVVDYGPAIEYLNWGSGNTVIDDKMTYSGGGQIKNFDNIFKKVMTVKTALAQSRNIPALYTFQQTTNAQKLEFAHNLNWYPEDKTGYINESSAIGGFITGINPLQAAAAYATFARGGIYIEPYSFTKIEYTETGETYEVKPKKYQAMSDSTAYIINMILKYAVSSGNVAAGKVSGTDLCGKTGTSTVDSAAKKAAGLKGDIIGDTWEVAYSPDIAIALWYGYDDQLDPVYHLIGNEGTLARKRMMQYLTKHLVPKNSTFEKPSSVVAREIELETDPVKLASEFTPANLRSTEYFKKGYEPTEESNRFSKLSAASDLKYTQNGTQVTLTWKAASTPKAIDVEYLRSYFNGNVYSRWAETYLQERINYNNATFGRFGYDIYLVTPAGNTYLGFTTNTTFTATATADGNTSFMVRAAYEKFKANQSDGITVAITPTQPTTSFTIEFTPTCVTVDSYNALGANPSNKVKVMSGGKDVTASSTITATCYDETNKETSCNSMVNGHKYRVDFKVKYANVERTKQITIQQSCS